MTAKADRIEKLVNDPDLKQAFENVRQKYFGMIEGSPLSDDTALLDIRKMLQLLRDVEEDLQEAIETGHLEDHRAKEQEGQGFLEDKMNGRQH